MSMVIKIALGVALGIVLGGGMLMLLSTTISIKVLDDLLKTKPPAVVANNFTPITQPPARSA